MRDQVAASEAISVALTLQRGLGARVKIIVAAEGCGEERFNAKFVSTLRAPRVNHVERGGPSCGTIDVGGTGFRTLRFPNQRCFRTTPLESAPTHAWMQLWRAGGLLRVCRFLRMISHSLEATGHAYFLPCTPVRDSACSPSHACKQNRWVSHASGWNVSL